MKRQFMILFSLCLLVLFTSSSSAFTGKCLLLGEALELWGELDLTEDWNTTTWQGHYYFHPEFVNDPSQLSLFWNQYAEKYTIESSLHLWNGSKESEKCVGCPFVHVKTEVTVPKIPNLLGSSFILVANGASVGSCVVGRSKLSSIDTKDQEKLEEAETELKPLCTFDSSVEVNRTVVFGRTQGNWSVETSIPLESLYYWEEGDFMFKGEVSSFAIPVKQIEWRLIKSLLGSSLFFRSEQILSQCIIGRNAPPPPPTTTETPPPATTGTPPATTETPPETSTAAPSTTPPPATTTEAPTLEQTTSEAPTTHGSEQTGVTDTPTITTTKAASGSSVESSTTPPPIITENWSDSSTGNNQGGLIAGIVIASLVVIAIFLCYWWRARQERNSRAGYVRSRGFGW